MIKHVLYSLFLHSLLLALVYVNFKTHINDDLSELKEGISVSVASFDHNKKSDIEQKAAPVKTKPQNKPAPKIEEKKEIKKPAPKKEIVKEKPIVKEIKKPEPKKIEAPKKANLPPLSEKQAEFKQKDEEKKEEVKKIVEEEKKDEVKTEEIVKEEENPQTQETVVQEEPAVEEAAQQSDTSENVVNDLENLSLSAREKFNIHTQLRGCYHRALQNNYDNKYKVTIKVNVAPDGTINFDPEKIIDVARYNNPKEKAYRQMMDGVIAALEFCSPLRNMPADKYEIWKEFTIEFDGQ